MHAILEAVFPSRIRAVRALLAPAGPESVAGLVEAAETVLAAVAHINEEASQSDWQALAEAVGIGAKLRKWHQAVRDSEVDADRHLRAARLQRSEWLTAESGYGADLKVITGVIDGDLSPSDVSALLERLARVPFPIAIFTGDTRRTPASRLHEDDVQNELAIAFLEFKINGQEAAAIHRLPANQLHDLELTLRVSRWPDKAEQLVLMPLSIEPEDLWDLPDFAFDRPAGDAPFTLRTHGRLAIKMPIAVGARPLEFLYTAEFSPVSAEQPVAVAGQRSLRLDSSDTREHLATGYASLDQRLIWLRDFLRAEPSIPESEISVAMMLARPLANLVGQAVQDNCFPEPIDEAALEKRVIAHLRRYPAIGVELEVQAHAGGGRTDLSFRQVRIELKVKNDTLITADDLERFALQAAAYAVSSDKAVAFLGVLDGSAKKTPPLTMAEAVQVITVKPGDRPIYVIAFLLQGNLARPSHLSR